MAAWGLFWFGFVVGLAIQVAGSIATTPAHPLIHHIDQFLEKRVALLPFASLLIFVAVTANRVLPDPRFSTLARQAMLVLRDKLFGHVSGHTHHHRATLFRFEKRWRLFGEKVLRVYERSGHTDNESSTFFRCSKNPEEYEGIAGRCFSYNEDIVLADLPDPSGGGEDLRNYAEATGVSEDWVEQRLRDRKPCARWFAALPIRMNEGKLWGVIVVDSMSPHGPGPDIAHEDVSGIVASILSRSAERGHL